MRQANDDAHELHTWAPALQRSLDESAGPLKRVVLLRTTDSTQDAARRMNAAAGDVVIAARQTSGRGRMGRLWADTGESGIAVTMVIARQQLQQDVTGRLAIAIAIAAARTAEQFLDRPVGIKWPNDVLVDGRKLAGVLIEQVESVALAGVGMNIAQTAFEGELADRAVSLAQLGAEVPRKEVLCTLLRAANTAIPLTDEQLCEAFAARDVLRGTETAFLVQGQRVAGTVLCVDPLRGMLVRTHDEIEQWLPAAVTSVCTP